MKLCYVDETGTDGNSPLVVFVGVIADVARVHRTRAEFEQLFQDLAGLPDKSISELKGSNLYYGKGRWDGVDGEVRHDAIRQLCDWLAERKHSLALAALDAKRFAGSDLAQLTSLDIWMCGALHVALQIQKAQEEEGIALATRLVVGYSGSDTTIVERLLGPTEDRWPVVRFGPGVGGPEAVTGFADDVMPMLSTGHQGAAYPIRRGRPHALFLKLRPLGIC